MSKRNKIKSKASSHQSMLKSLKKTQEEFMTKLFRMLKFSRLKLLNLISSNRLGNDCLDFVGDGFPSRNVKGPSYGFVV